MNARTYVLYIFHNYKHITLFVFCVEFSPDFDYNISKKTEMFSQFITYESCDGSDRTVK